MKTCKELGYKVGDEFVVLKETTFTKGSIVSLYYDDRSDSPKFKLISGKCFYNLCGDDPGAFIGLEHVEKLENTNTGGSVDYYKVYVTNPTNFEWQYDAECNDIIEALNMNFAEGNIFKAVWRKAAARQGKNKQGYDNGKYDAEKIVFFANRLLTMED